MENKVEGFRGLKGKVYLCVYEREENSERESESDMVRREMK